VSHDSLDVVTISSICTNRHLLFSSHSALRDAQKFAEILDRYEDDFDQALPQYSKERVPEGNALTDIALNLYCFDTGVGVRTMILGLVRSILHYLFPKLVGAGPNEILARSEFTLSQVYQAGNDQGILTKHREINERIRRETFERQTGMIVEKPKSSFRLYAIVGAVLAGGAGTLIAMK
jgi:hypothetical protein